MLCHKFKCIYIHIPKSAGQSIHKIFARQLGYYQNKNAPLLLNLNNDPRLGPPALGHLKASEYVSCGHISKELFDSYFKFSFVRNPWARIVSEYKYRGHIRKYDFKSFLFKHLPKPEFTDAYTHIIPQYDFLYDENGELLVDYVGRFENLQKDFDEVCGKIGLAQTNIPYRNSSSTSFKLPECLYGIKDSLHSAIRKLRDFISIKQRKNTYPNYTEYYDDETREFVAELYRKDIDTFGYKFERRPSPARLPIYKATAASRGIDRVPLQFFFGHGG